MIKRIVVHFPYAKNSFMICTDNLKLLELLKIYYGTMVSDEYLNVTILRYICGIFSIDNDKSSEKIIDLDVNHIICNIVMYIRNHIKLDDDWYIYHASCSTIGNKTYMFVGHSSSGKTTLTTFLHYQPNVTTICEDICIINYKTLQVVSINRPFFLRQTSYDLLVAHYNLNIIDEGKFRYNISEKIIAYPNSIVPNVLYKVDEIIFLKLNNKFEKIRVNGLENLLINSFNELNIYKGVCSSSIISKKIPMYNMNYYDLREVYQNLLFSDGQEI